MTPEELQEVVAAVIAALKTNGKTIDQLTAVTSLADTDNLEISNGKKVSFGKLKELVAAAVTVSAEEIKGWEMIESTDDLPEDPTQAQQEKAYVIADTSTMYVYVGYGGDTLDGLYQSLNMKGEDGAPGPPGADGHDGVDLGEVALVNNLTEGGEGSALTAEMGKTLKGLIDSQTFPIVNDLTTGGEESALSAEQGKVLAGNETVTMTATGALAQSSGNQSVNVPISLKKGTKYTITLSSDVSNTGYFYVDGYKVDNTNARIVPQTTADLTTEREFELTADADYVYLRVTVRAVSATGTLTITCNGVVHYDKIDEHVKTAFGKNLCNPNDIRNGTNIGVTYISQGYITNLYASSNGCTGYIPIKNGQTLVCNKNTSSNTNNYCALFAHIGDLIAIDGTLSLQSTSAGYKTITNNLGYDAFAVFNIAKDATDVQVEVGSTPTSYEEFNPIHGYLDIVSHEDYGTIGSYYPEQVDTIINVLDKNKSIDRLRFIHVSDSHGNDIGEADSIVDDIEADFLVHTGDMVADKYSDDFSGLKSRLLAVTAPTFVVLGNHDCYQSSSVADRFSKYIDPLNTHNGLVGNTKTYYSVDYATEKVKCIFLDMCDAIEDSTLNMSYYVSASKMTSTQINWFISELKAAITNNYHVAIFMHVAPAYLGKYKEDWYDAQVSKAIGVSFLCDIVDAFINKTSFTVTHDGNTYTDTFAGYGAFCGWFCGHTHYDAHGWLEDHEKQFCSTVPRPWRNSDAEDGTYRVPKLGVTWDYVTIDTKMRKVSVYRVGNQTTWFATKRESFYYRY